MEKNIVFFTNIELWSIVENKGGKAQISTIESYIYNGWNVFLISTAGGIPNYIKREAHVVERLFPTLNSLCNSKYKLVRQVKYFKQFMMSSFFYKEGRNIIKGLKSSKNTILYAYEVDSVLAAKKLSKKYNLPLVTRFQGTVHTETVDNIINSVRYFPHLQAMKCESNIAIMTNDGTKGLETLRRLGNKSKELYFWRNGVAPKDIKLIEQRLLLKDAFGFTNKFVFLTVSRLVDWKRLDRSINAMSALLQTFPDLKTYVELHIIGDGDARPELEKMASELNISNNIIFHGAIPQIDVFKYMIASDVFMSLYDLSNVGNPLLEAMTCGKPIITLNVGDTYELIKDNENGFLVNVEDIADIPSKMYSLINDSDLRDRLGKNALLTSEREFWTWEDRMSEEQSKVVKLLLDNEE